MRPLAERVERGAALLDEKVQGWSARVDADRLDLRSCRDCVVGQVFADLVYDDDGYDVVAYDEGIYQLGITRRGAGETAHGFSLPHWSDDDDDYAALTALWRSEIEARR